MSSTAQEGVTADMAERILDAEFKNIVKKVAGGKTLTVAERARVQARASGCTDATAYAKTVVELASLLGVTRRTIGTWQKLDGAPKTLPNGDFPVSEWREFVRVRGLKTNQPTTTNEEALKARKLLAEVEERELKVGIKKGEFALLADVRRDWLTQVGKAIALLRAKFENELPPILSGQDAQGIREECARAIDEVCKVLHTGGGNTP
jgi:hypothetical protein